MKKLSYILMLLFAVHVASAQQELVTGLEANPEVHNSNSLLKSMQASFIDTVNLPFFDDFSYNATSPDQNKWQDSYVFINHTYEKDPISTGVATFDVLNDAGVIYSNANTSSFSADVLTSQPIDLSGRNNVYLSFYFQTYGKGEIPDQKDSLILEFKAPDAPSFTKVRAFCRSAASTTPITTTDTFHLVMVPITDTIYLKTGFQFRFRNLASLNYPPDLPGKRSNVDHWNIDYVYLNDNRGSDDTVFADLTFTKPLGANTVLKAYTAIPRMHYEPAKYAAFNYEFPLAVKNHYSDSAKNFEINYEIIADGTVIENNDFGTYSLEKYQLEDKFLVSFLAQDYVDTSVKELSVKAYFNYGTNNKLENDTIRYMQKFSSYYAYDDGTSEGNYGFKGTSEGCMFAEKFVSYQTDKINAILIAFNPTYLDTTQNAPFVLTVWEESADTALPGNILYEQDATVQWNSANRFTAYPLNTLVNITATKPFYVGWRQTKSYYINVGYDKNCSYPDKQFINTGVGWQKSSNTGVVMMRPSMGSEPYVSVPAVNAPTDGIIVYPNPARDFLYLNIPEGYSQNDIAVSIYSVMGKKIFASLRYEGGISLENFTAGTYIIMIGNETSGFVHKKFIVAK